MLFLKQHGRKQVSGNQSYWGWLSVAALLAASVLPSDALADRKLSGSEIQAAAPGQWSGSYKNVPLQLTIVEGGTVAGRFAGVPHSGTWRVSGSQFCLTFRALSAVKTKCGNVHLNGNKLYGFFTKKGRARLYLTRL
jgi:hypothetical protein